MRVESPLGEYALVLRRLERRPGGVAIVGLVAGIESSVVLDARELRAAAKALVATLAAVALLIAWRSQR